MTNGKQRPTVTLILGIINIAFGVLGICGGLFGLAGNLAPGGAQGQIEFPEEVKGWMNLLQGVGLALSVVLLVAGIGLIKVQNWGRLLSIIYAIVDIPVSLASTIITTRAIKPMLEQQGGDVPPEAMNMIFASSIGIGVCCGLIYPIVLLIVLNLRDVKAAFLGGGAATPPAVPPQS